MKLNIANPPTGAQKLIEVEDEKKLRIFWDKRMAQEVNGDALGDEFKGYIFRITGGNDKDGFPMKQGVLVPHRVRLLLGGKTTCFRSKRKGERKRKSVRGCIVAPDLSVLDLVIVKKGENELPGLTDRSIPRRLGPKRASKIRKLFNLSKEDDVRKYVIRREIPEHEGKDGKIVKRRSKAPKIQRLVTPAVLQRKRHRIAVRRRQRQKSKREALDYAKLIAQRSREKREALVSKRRSSQRVSSKKDDAEKPAAKGKGKDSKAAPSKVAKKDAKSDVKSKAPAKSASKSGKDAKAAPAKGKAPAKDAKAAKPAKAAAKAPAKSSGKKDEKPAAKAAAKGKAAPAEKSAKPDPAKAAAKSAPAKKDAPAKAPSKAAAKAPAKSAAPAKAPAKPKGGKK